MAGAVAVTMGVGAGVAQAGPDRPKGADGLHWLVGDHHVHTLYSNDGKYRVADHVRQARRHGLDWIVISDHGNAQHARIGVELVNPHLVAARTELGPEMLVFQGLEWNIPGAEHGTVFVHPGPDEVAVLREFEALYDARVNGTRDGTPANEALAVQALVWLAGQVQQRRVSDALFLANHPSRLGIDSPHEFRAWRAAAPSIAVGMEGAPGHQAGGLPAPHTSTTTGRGLYQNAPSAFSFPGYPAEAYRTWGGFDWVTATVGGMWDSMLAEGRPFWITATSDCHNVYTDTAAVGAGSNYDVDGFIREPVYSGTVDLTENDYWPGQYTRIHVGALDPTYAGVMEGIRAGRMWVDHGSLLDGLSVRLRGGGQDAVLGGSITVPRGTEVELVVDVTPAAAANWAQFVPALARVDVISGPVTGPATDPDAVVAPGTRVVGSFDVTGRTGSIAVVHRLGAVEGPLFVRVRGTDGKRGQVGFHGAGVDPAGPAIDAIGNADPWADLWFYTNPIWVFVS